MPDELELPNGELVTSEDVILYNDYPYRVAFVDDDTYDFVLSPLYWGGSGMDIPFRDREALADQWGPDSRGTMTPAEWEQWLREARHDDRFDGDELDALASELPISDGLLARVRRRLGL